MTKKYYIIIALSSTAFLGVDGTVKRQTPYQRFRPAAFETRADAKKALSEIAHDDLLGPWWEISEMD